MTWFPIGMAQTKTVTDFLLKLAQNWVFYYHDYVRSALLNRFYSFSPELLYKHIWYTNGIVLIPEAFQTDSNTENTDQFVTNSNIE